MKRLYIPLLMAAISLLVAVPVLAAYYADIAVTESNGTDYDMLAMDVSLDIDYMAEYGFIDDDGLDMRIKDSQSNALPFMLAEDKIAFASDITADTVSRFQMTTGNTPLSSFPVTVGDGGYVTITAHANLEFGNNFEVEVEGYVDTSKAGYPIIEAEEDSTEDAQTTSHDVDLPTGIEVGDLLLLLFSCYDPETASVTITWDGDWTELEEQHVNGYSRGIAYRVADGDEGAAVTVTTGATGYSAHKTYRISGYQGIPEASADATGNDANPNSANLATSWGIPNGSLFISFFGGGTAGSRTLNSYPSNYWDGSFVKSTNGYAYLGSAIKPKQAASEDAGQYTLTGGAINWAAWTIGVRAEGSPLICKNDAFHLYPIGGDEVKALIVDSTPLTVTASSLGTDEYKINVWADTTDFGIDIDDFTKDSMALGGVSVPGNANDWLIGGLPYYDYYTHTTSSTLRITYEPDSIIVGTTLPNEENPGTYDGTITWGSNPAGISISTSGLQLESTYYFEDVEGTSEDIFKPEPAELISGVALERLENNPMYPLVEGIVDASNNRLTTSLVWILGAWIITIAAYIATFILMREHIIFAGLVGEGLAILFYAMGIFDYWILILFAFGIIAGVVQERTPTW